MRSLSRWLAVWTLDILDFCTCVYVRTLVHELLVVYSMYPGSDDQSTWSQGFCATSNTHGGSDLLRDALIV